MSMCGFVHTLFSKDLAISKTVKFPDAVQRIELFTLGYSLDFSAAKDLQFFVSNACYFFHRPVSYYKQEFEKVGSRSFLLSCFYSKS